MNDIRYEKGTQTAEGQARCIKRSNVGYCNSHGYNIILTV